MYLIPSGPLPPNPADLFRSERLETLIASISEQSDIVLIDSPPALAASDALLVASSVDGVLIVSRANQTRIDKLQEAVNSLPETTR